MNTRIYLGIILLFCFSCSKKWDDHIGKTEAASNKTLYEVMGDKPEFASFFSLVNKSGYGEDLKSSKNFTVLVPTNEAIESVKALYDFNDTTVVRSFVGYHILNAVYDVNESSDTIRVRNLRNKYVELTHGAFDGVVAQQKNNVAGNGLYHVIGTPLKPLQNIYTLVNTLYAETEQISTLFKYDSSFFAAWYNEVKRPLTTESSKYTFFVVDDAYFNQEYDQMKPFYYTHYTDDIADSTSKYYTSKALMRDFIVPGDINIDAATTELTSLSNTKLTVNKDDIISRVKTSNGTVYRVSKLDYTLSDRIKEIKILGSKPSGYKQNDKRGNTFFRTKRDTLGNIYEDIEIYDHKVTSFYAKFRAANANTVKYKVYGRAISGLPGDPQTAAFIQYVYYFNPLAVSANEPDLYKKSVINNTGAADTRMTFSVAPLFHDEVYLGEYTQDEFGYLPLLVMSNGTGPIILEYLRFVPQLP
ncbi:MAG TPA: fasciclin domain-containing protein [Niabella sp.]|nr:fasciclin domain-containing protein [Niabella sp.]HQW13746.1 fasciclin domain-containing protein [Niabella sp.]HQX19141.1 fasciclin domain-containing protein [Niabella sp.]HQX42054.1 fasciclin domain-containing protein [Niabella sp.]HRB06430.1 fasciclin domain-containing protein [Niabella sp.]